MHARKKIKRKFTCGYRGLKSRVKVLADLVSDESSLPDLRRATFSLYPPSQGKERVLVSSYPSEDANPIVEALRSRRHLTPLASQRPPLQVLSLWGLGLQPMNFGWGYKHSVHNSAKREHGRDGACLCECLPDCVSHAVCPRSAKTAALGVKAGPVFSSARSQQPPEWLVLCLQGASSPSCPSNQLPTLKSVKPGNKSALETLGVTG